MDRPMTSWPCSVSRAAATDESTPPDIATTIRISQNLHSPRRREGHEDARRTSILYMTYLFVRLRVLRAFVVDVHADTGLLVSPRSFSTSLGSTSTTRSTSSGVENIPRLKRREFCVRWEGRPIAFSTCDGSSVPDEHADPVETATPSRSSAMRSDSASVRSKLMFVVLGTRGERTPFSAVPVTP